MQTDAHSYLFMVLKTWNAGEGYVMDVYSVLSLYVVNIVTLLAIC